MFFLFLLCEINENSIISYEESEISFFICRFKIYYFVQFTLNLVFHDRINETARMAKSTKKMEFVLQIDEEFKFIYQFFLVNLDFELDFRGCLI